MFREYREGDEVCIINSLRQSDVEECRHLYPDFKAGQLLIDSVISSIELKTIVHKNHIIGICGVAYTPLGHAVWMLGNYRMECTSARVMLLREAPSVISEWVNKYKYLYNFCSDNKMLVKALETLGFDVSKPNTKGVRKLSICA